MTITKVNNVYVGILKDHQRGGAWYATASTRTAVIEELLFNLFLANK